ncbi:MAG: hypothetical protein ACI4YB_06615 [Oscillospiraceae bacterium]
MIDKRFAAVIIAALCLSACGSTQTGSDNTEEATASLTESTIETTSETTTAETTVQSENSAEPTEAIPPVIEIMGQKYDTNEYISYLTVDADTCFEVTEEDKKNIELLKNSGISPWYVRVINCKDHDLGFLSELDGFSDAEFWDLGDSEYMSIGYFSKFDELRSARFVNYSGDGATLSNSMIDTNVEVTKVYAQDFRLWDGISFSANCRGSKTEYSSNEEYTDGTPPTDKPYVKAAPCVQSYLEDGAPLANAYYTEDKLKETGNTLTAVFCNPTDEEVVIDCVSVHDAVTEHWVPMADGESSYVPLAVTVAPHDEFCFELTKDMFDYSSVTGGVYYVNFAYGYEGFESASSYFILKNSEENEGLGRLDGEQRAVFEKALSYVQEYFGCSHHMTEEYASSHTADEFIGQFLDAFTYDCASSFAQSYIDENGNLKEIFAERGSTLYSVETCFYVINGGNEFDIVSITANNHSDISYHTWLDCCGVRMKKTIDGWRVDKFTLWW